MLPMVTRMRELVSVSVVKLEEMSRQHGGQECVFSNRDGFTQMPQVCVGDQHICVACPAGKISQL